MLTAIFKRLLPLKNQFNLRIVALSRRGFPGSTPFHPSERTFLTGDEEAQAAASEETKSKFHTLRGVEILRFINGFIQRAGTPPIHTNVVDGKVSGGIMLVGWSMGSTYSMAAISSMDSPLLSDEMRDRLGSYLRVLVLLGAFQDILR
jgi:pimeloyl-ACP methyl ester carboxylesterase